MAASALSLGPFMAVAFLSLTYYYIGYIGAGRRFTVIVVLCISPLLLTPVEGDLPGPLLAQGSNGGYPWGGCIPPFALSHHPPAHSSWEVPLPWGQAFFLSLPAGKTLQTKERSMETIKWFKRASN